MTNCLHTLLSDLSFWALVAMVTTAAYKLDTYLRWRMIMRISRPILCAAAMLFPIFALAHHGAGSFDLSKTIELSGKLTKIDLINPHSWLYFENAGKDGKVSRYRCEM